MKDTINRLDQLRGHIDEIDTQILRLFEQRMNCAREVGRYKAEHDQPVFVPDRESELLWKKLEELQDKSLSAACESVFRVLMNVSKDEQKRMKPNKPVMPLRLEELTVAYAGVPGAFGEQAAWESFGEQAQYLNYRHFSEVVDSIREGKANYGLLPIENSTGGAINEVYDLLGEKGCFIVGECYVRAEQCLLGLPGTNLDRVRNVYSHPQGLRQCSIFLSGHSWNECAYSNTAAAAQYVAKQKDPSNVAIASRRAAVCYGLDVLVPDIYDRNDNVTRFVIISIENKQMSGQGKATIALSLKHRCGSLHAVLACLRDHNLNLTKLESRNIPGNAWEYRFYLDFEGDVSEKGVQQLLGSLNELTTENQLLGCYPPAKRLS